MCRRIECPKCKKPGFVGCGAHIEAVLGDVVKNERCTCNGVGMASPSPSILDALKSLIR